MPYLNPADLKFAMGRHLYKKGSSKDRKRQTIHFYVHLSRQLTPHGRYEEQKEMPQTKPPEAQNVLGVYRAKWH